MHEYMNRLAADVGTERGVARQYKGYIACAKHIYETSGLIGFYRGMGVSLGGVMLFKALFMGGYDIAKAVCDLPTDSSAIGYRLLLAQGVTAFVGAACYPLDTVRRRIMMQVSISCFLSI
jgi:solute carrier family 25 (adenine nucleotide translocator) protein 4/5/6/31